MAISDLPIDHASLARFMEPRKKIIITDLLLSSLLFYALLIGSARASSLEWTVLFAVMAGFILFRCVVFMHEAHHLRDKMPVLGILYDALIGIPQKMPSFTYDPHKYHHSCATYGTRLDPEYEPIAHNPPSTLLLAPIIFLFVPVFYFFRHGLLPLLMPFLGSQIRRTIFARASTFAMNLAFVRPEPSAREKRKWYLQEALCTGVTVVALLLMYKGVWPTRLLLSWYVAFYTFYFVNYYRVLASHRYQGFSDGVSLKMQVLDSPTVLGENIFNFFWFPLGLQYHTLHHMLPNAPAHNFSTIHRHLMATLSADHPYKASIYRNYPEAVSRLVHAMKKTNRERKPLTVTR